LDDVRAYDELSFIPTDLIVSVFRELGLTTARVGAELGAEQRLGISDLEFKALQSTLPGIEWVDASDTLWTLRSIKSEAEIA
jgi:Xaa-Pro aminopeptidase